MSFPSPSNSFPTLAMYQAWYRNLTVGGIIAGTSYQLVSVQGLDGIPIVGGDAQRALDTGMFAGLDVGSERDITLSIVVAAPTINYPSIASARTALAAARQTLGQAFGVPGYSSESPFYYQAENGLFGCTARPEKFNFTKDLNMIQAAGGVATILLRATDPRIYACPTKTVTMGLPAPLGGLAFPVTFNASFGGGGAGATFSIYNNGTIEMRPVVVFTGPCVNPVIQNTSINGSPSVGFNITLNTGDTLTVDFDMQTAVLVLSGSTQGVSRRNTLLSSSTFFNLPPGLNTLKFTTSDGTQVAGTCTVQSADAYASI